MDINKPVDNPSLIAAIKVMCAENNEKNQADMINEVIKASFITPVKITPDPPAPDKDGNTVLPKETVIGFVTLENEENEEFFIAFTDWQQLAKWREKGDEQTIIVTYADLSTLVLDPRGKSSGFVINPYSDNIVIKKQLIKTLNEQRKKKPDEK